MTSDARMNCPTDVLSTFAASTFKSPVYRYVVTSMPSKPIHPIGLPFAASYSFHLWDLFAFFGLVEDFIKCPTEADLQWQKNVRDEMMSFILYGFPKSEFWLPYPSVTATLSSQTHAVKAYNPVQCEFWLQNGFYSYAWIN